MIAAGLFEGGVAVHRLILCVAISLAGCGAAKQPVPPSDSINPDLYTSSSEMFYITPEEIEGIKQNALQGDNVQLERLIDFYMFSTPPDEVAAEAELQKWQEIGAERGLKGAAHNLLYYASAKSGPDCSTIRRHALSLSATQLSSLRDYNSFTAKCLEGKR